MDKSIEKPFTEARVTFLLITRALNDVDLSLRLVELQSDASWVDGGMNALAGAIEQSQRLMTQLNELMLALYKLPAEPSKPIKNQTENVKATDA